MDSKKNRKNRDSVLATEGSTAPETGQYGQSSGGSPPDTSGNVRNIRQTQAWKASQQGLSRMWNNYKTTLALDFKRRSRNEQEALVQMLCMIVTFGVTGLGLLLFYAFIPLFGRVFGVPAAGFAAYWVGNKIVTPVVLARIEDHLNKE